MVQKCRKFCYRNCSKTPFPELDVIFVSRSVLAISFISSINGYGCEFSGGLFTLAFDLFTINGQLAESIYATCPFQAGTEDTVCFPKLIYRTLEHHVSEGVVFVSPENSWADKSPVPGNSLKLWCVNKACLCFHLQTQKSLRKSRHLMKDANLHAGTSFPDSALLSPYLLPHFPWLYVSCFPSSSSPSNRRSSVQRTNKNLGSPFIALTSLQSCQMADSKSKPSPYLPLIWSIPLAASTFFSPPLTTIKMTLSHTAPTGFQQETRCLQHFHISTSFSNQTLCQSWIRNQ